MKVLLDECIDRSLVEFLPNHEVVHVRDLGLLGIKNGELVKFAASDFDCLLTVDRNMQHQTSLKDLKVSVAIFTCRGRSFDWRAVASAFEASVDQLVLGSYLVILVD